MTHDELYKKHNEFTQLKRPSGWIQWKGTGVCIDLHCECGYHSHLDVEFLYFFKCSNCNTLYQVGDCVPLRKLSTEERQFVESNCSASAIHTNEQPIESHEPSFDYEKLTSQDK